MSQSQQPLPVVVVRGQRIGFLGTWAMANPGTCTVYIHRGSRSELSHLVHVVRVSVGEVRLPLLDRVAQIVNQVA